MANPYHHAMSSVRRNGGTVEDYLPIHAWFDSTKACLGDVRHRLILHNAFGIALADQVFGPVVIRKNDRGDLIERRAQLKAELAVVEQELIDAGKVVPTRYIAEQHVMEDFGRIPSVPDCFEGTPIREWMIKGARKFVQEFRLETGKI